jgi:hypothetical protein
MRGLIAGALVGWVFFVAASPAAASHGAAEQGQGNCLVQVLAPIPPGGLGSAVSGFAQSAGGEAFAEFIAGFAQLQECPF